MGNVLFGDDGFGVEVARALRSRALPADVEVREIGIRGLDLAFALAEGYRAAVLAIWSSAAGRRGPCIVSIPPCRARRR